MVKRYIPPIENERVRLRLLEESDLPLTLAWRNQDHIRKWFIHSDIILPEQHRAWFAKYQERDDDFIFVIEELEILRRPVGQVSLHNISWSQQRAEFGRLMIGDPEARGKGLGKQATQLLLAMAFNQFHLNEVYLTVFEENAPAVAIYQQCGFQPNGRSNDLLKMCLFNTAGG